MKHRHAFSPRIAIIAPSTSGKSRTKQEFKDELDINNILKKYNKTGQLPDMIRKDPKYGDFSSPLDYQESMNLVLHAHEQFQNLPARARERFNNDPEKFLVFATDPANAKEMVRLGLAVKRPSDGQPGASAPESNTPSPQVPEAGSGGTPGEEAAPPKSKGKGAK